MAKDTDWIKELCVVLLRGVGSAAVLLSSASGKQFLVQPDDGGHSQEVKLEVEDEEDEEEKGERRVKKGCFAIRDAQTNAALGSFVVDKLFLDQKGALLPQPVAKGWTSATSVELCKQLLGKFSPIGAPFCNTLADTVANVLGSLDREAYTKTTKSLLEKLPATNKDLVEALADLKSSWAADRPAEKAVAAVLSVVQKNLEQGAVGLPEAAYSGFHMLIYLASSISRFRQGSDGLHGAAKAADHVALMGSIATALAHGTGNKELARTINTCSKLGAGLLRSVGVVLASGGPVPSGVAVVTAVLDLLGLFRGKAGDQGIKELEQLINQGFTALSHSLYDLTCACAQSFKRLDSVLTAMQVDAWQNFTKVHMDLATANAALARLQQQAGEMLENLWALSHQVQRTEGTLMERMQSQSSADVRQRVHEAVLQLPDQPSLEQARKALACVLSHFTSSLAPEPIKVLLCGDAVVQILTRLTSSQKAELGELVKELRERLLLSTDALLVAMRGFVRSVPSTKEQMAELIGRLQEATAVDARANLEDASAFGHRRLLELCNVAVNKAVQELNASAELAMDPQYCVLYRRCRHTGMWYVTELRMREPIAVQEQGALLDKQNAASVRANLEAALAYLQQLVKQSLPGDEYNAQNPPVYTVCALDKSNSGLPPLPSALFLGALAKPLLPLLSQAQQLCPSLSVECAYSLDAQRILHAEWVVVAPDLSRVPIGRCKSTQAVPLCPLLKDPNCSLLLALAGQPIPTGTHFDKFLWGVDQFPDGVHEFRGHHVVNAASKKLVFVPCPVDDSKATKVLEQAIAKESATALEQAKSALRRSPDMAALQSLALQFNKSVELHGGAAPFAPSFAEACLNGECVVELKMEEEAVGQVTETLDAVDTLARRLRAQTNLAEEAVLIKQQCQRPADVVDYDDIKEAKVDDGLRVARDRCISSCRTLLCVVHHMGNAGVPAALQQQIVYNTLKDMVKTDEFQQLLGDLPQYVIEDAAAVIVAARAIRGDDLSDAAVLQSLSLTSKLLKDV